MARMRQMYTDLMGPAGFKPAFNLRCNCGRSKPLGHPHTRDRMASAFKQHRLPLPISFMAGQLGGDFHHITGLEIDPTNTAQPWITGLRHPKTQRLIEPLNAVGSKLIRKMMVGFIGLGHHKQTACVFIYTVHNAGPPFAANPGKGVGAMIEQRIDQSATWRARRRVHHHARRFVDHNQMGIFIDHLKRDVFRLGRDFGRVRQRDFDLGAGGNLGFRTICDFSIDAHCALLD